MKIKIKKRKIKTHTARASRPLQQLDSRLRVCLFFVKFLLIFYFYFIFAPSHVVRVCLEIAQQERRRRRRRRESERE